MTTPHEPQPPDARITPPIDVVTHPMTPQTWTPQQDIALRRLRAQREARDRRERNRLEYGRFLVERGIISEHVSEGN